jgi:hypothetical protein
MPDLVRVSGLPENEKVQCERIANLIRTLRQLDIHGSNEWETYLRFERGFEGKSSELAVALADRIARGREFPAKGRLIATGSVDDLGRVDLPPESCERKCRLILEQVKPGDRVLLPAAWNTHLPARFRKNMIERGASFASLERVL